ncbi:MAG TPA: flavin reductase family protein [Ktedonobacteraceae bacterium]|jgi:flavin reductase (DIM6/NTAB) family NADH-FMN oxidoreductase RutF|nr:flavin reductase family protein [Ktedonobacteraceae bacterium]
MAIEKDFFRQVMGCFATGVTVVTTQHEGELGGLTVNAFCSVSLDPPLVLVCIDRNSSTLQLMHESKRFAVNMLRDDQEAISRCFATHSEERFDRFCEVPYRTIATGAPVLDHVLAFIDARVVAEYPGGDHMIFLGQVEAMGTDGKVIFADDELARQQPSLISGNGAGSSREPLAFFRGKYRQLTEQAQALVSTLNEEVGK